MYWWDEFFHAFDSIFFSEGKNDRQLCFLLSISIKFKMAVMEKSNSSVYAEFNADGGGRFTNFV